jgi:hypothetical protein
MKSTIWIEHENELIAHHGRYRIVLILKGIKGFVAGILSVEYYRTYLSSLQGSTNLSRRYIILVAPFNLFVFALEYTFNLRSKDLPCIIPKLICLWTFWEGRQCVFEMFHEFDNFTPKFFSCRLFTSH